MLVLFYGCAAKGPQIKTDMAPGDKEDVYFAGISFMGNSGDMELNYKYSSEIIKESKDGSVSSLRAYYDNLVKLAKPEHIRIVKDENGEFAKAGVYGDKVVTLALAIDRERVSFIKQPNGKYKTVTQIGGQIVAMDFNSSALIATVPLDAIYIGESYNAPSKGNPMEKEKKELVKKVLFKTFAREFVKKLEAVVIKKTYRNRIQVKNIVLGEKSLRRLKESGEKPDVYKARVAGVFARGISDTLFVPMLPYAADNTAGTMFLAMENADKELKIPSADYEINITVQGYNVAESEPNGPEKAVTFVSYFNITAEVAGSGRPFFNGDLRGIASKRILVSQGIKDLDVWTSLFDSTRELADGFAENVYKPSSEWLKLALGKGQDKKAVKKGLRELAEVLDKCR